MDFAIDLGPAPDLSNPLSVLWFVYTHGLWLFFVATLIRGGWMFWVYTVQNRYDGAITHMTLAISVPKTTEQTPKAVENFFAHLTGTMSGSGNFIEKHFKGKNQETLSVELVSRGGNVQYYVNTPSKFRNLIEASIYAQYPDAEIVEATDYTDELPSRFPNEHYDLWGTELTLKKDSEYPIKTYQAFEHTLQGTFKDPLASLLEYLGTFLPGEEAWVQIILKPVGDDWKKKSDATAKKIMGVPVKKTHSPIHTMTAPIIANIEGILATAVGYQAPAVVKEVKKDAPPSLMQHLSPGEKNLIEAIQNKASRPAFAVKIRLVYIARKEIFNKGKMIAGVFGAFQQLSDANAFGMDKGTKVGANYYQVERRAAVKKNKILKAYRGRSGGRGAAPFILNVEELATIWHFPTIDIKAPLLRKTEAKRAEPPTALPTREEAFAHIPETPFPSLGGEDEGSEIPSNLPFA